MSPPNPGPSTRPAPTTDQDLVANDIAWSDVAETRVMLEKMRLLCHSRKELKKAGYVLEPLTEDAIEGKLRCLRCGARPKRRPQKTSKYLTGDSTAGSAAGSGSKTSEKDKGLGQDTPAEAAEPRPKCLYHTGRVVNKKFSCCGKHVSQAGCTSDKEHDLPDADSVLKEYWGYHMTPDPRPTYHATPPTAAAETAAAAGTTYPRPDPNMTKSRAISLDCEMGVSARGDSELIRITAADFFSRVVLLDTLVCPSVPMKHYNTKYSGVSAADMRQAVQSQTCVFGRNKARDLLFQHVRPETMVVVHGGPGDLTSLRWIHSRIIDTHLLQSYTGTKTPGGKSLRNLCRVRLDIEVQQQQRHDGQGRPRAGHDSLEDALACRELAIDWLKGIPDT